MHQLQQRRILKYNISHNEADDLKIRMLNWCSRFSIHVFLDSNHYTSAYSRYECIAAAGAMSIVTGSLQAVQDAHNASKDWLFGHISYDHKSELFPRLNTSQGVCNDDFPTLHFFVPETVCYIDADCSTLTIATFHDPDDIYRQMLAAEHTALSLPSLAFTSLFTEQEYIETVNVLRHHIEEGDCYEINFCNKGFCENVDIEPLSVFKALNTLSPAPFAAFYRLNSSYMMCASPERYLRKQGRQILSQPIKGTARRSADEQEDNAIKHRLYNDIKERAENVMIVDLVRNDLARSCDTGSVHVDELFGIYSYPQVHQMISTVSGTLRDNQSFTDAIAHSFPMGSMTGAPKYKVMQLIDKYEHTARGLFSGSIGYIDPAGDMDLNVIIRSLFYNSDTRYLYYHTGGAITYDSVPGQEWAEMRLKAWALERIFS